MPAGMFGIWLDIHYQFLVEARCKMTSKHAFTAAGRLLLHVCQVWDAPPASLLDSTIHHQFAVAQPRELPHYGLHHCVTLCMLQCAASEVRYHIVHEAFSVPQAAPFGDLCRNTELGVSLTAVHYLCSFRSVCQYLCRKMGTCETEVASGCQPHRCVRRLTPYNAQLDTV